MATPALVDRVIDVLQHSQADSRMMAARELVEAGVLRSRGCLPRGTLETAASAELRSEQLQVIFAAIESADEELQSLLITGLGEWGGEEAAVDIAAQLDAAESPRIIDHCLAALERIGGPVSTTAIVRQILVGNPRTRKLAERHLLELACGGTGDLADPAEQGGLNGLSRRVFSVTDWRSFCELQLDNDRIAPFNGWLKRYDPQYRKIEIPSGSLKGDEVGPVVSLRRRYRLHVGQLLTGQIKTMEDACVIVDIGDVTGLIEMKKHPKRPQEVMQVGRVIAVKVAAISPNIKLQFATTPRGGRLIRFRQSKFLARYKKRAELKGDQNPELSQQFVRPRKNKQ